MKLDCDVVVIPADDISTRRIFVHHKPGSIIEIKIQDGWTATYPIPNEITIDDAGRGLLDIGPFLTRSFVSHKTIILCSCDGETAKIHLHVVDKRDYNTDVYS